MSTLPASLPERGRRRATGPRAAQTSRDPGGLFRVSQPTARGPVRQRTRHRATWRPRNGSHVYDTTLRDGAQQEGLNLSVADKLAIARQLDELGVGYIEGGWPGANPKDTEFFRRAARRARPAARDAGGVRRDPAGRACVAADDPLVAALRDSGASRGHAGRQVARPARRARAADHARGEPRDGPRHRRAPARPRGSRCSSTPSTSSTATAPTATTRSRCCGRRTRPAPRWSRCATPTAACCPAGSPTSSHDVVEADRRAGRHPLPQRHRLRGRQLAGRRRRRRHATCRARINGYGERTGNADLRRGRRQPRAQAAAAQVLPDGRLRRGHPDRARRRRGHQRPAGVAPAVRRRSRVRAQGRAARQRDQGRPGPLPAHRPGRTSATTCGCSSPTWPAGPSIELKGRELGFDLAGDTELVDPGHRPGQGAGVRGLHLRGRRRVVRAAAARGGRGRAARRTSTSSPGG